ncbi:MAG: hypothetical protein HZA60_06205 [Deltaproteobacteria bacterium]|nr:hypothetical protein [Deltaproteobacteria bacterium]
MGGEHRINHTSRFGAFSFRPRLAIVLVLLTVTVGVVGYHISREPSTRRVEGMAREAMRIFAASQKDGKAGASRDPGEIEDRVRDWVGAKVLLPRDEDLFVYRGATREKVGMQAAAAVRLTFAEDPFLLLIVRPDPLRAPEPSATLFAGSSFLSWEKEGKSFVFWERDGVLFFLVSDVDLTRTFDLVRRYFT